MNTSLYRKGLDCMSINISKTINCNKVIINEVHQAFIQTMKLEGICHANLETTR